MLKSWELISEVVALPLALATFVGFVMGLLVEPGRRREYYSFASILMLLMLAVILGSMRRVEGWFLIPLVIASGISAMGRWLNPERKPGWWQTPVATMIFFVGTILCFPEDHGLTEAIIALIGLGALIALAIKANASTTSPD